MIKETKKKLKPIEAKKFYTTILVMLQSLLIMVCAQIDQIYLKLFSLIILFALQWLTVKGIVDNAYSQYQ